MSLSSKHLSTVHALCVSVVNNTKHFSHISLATLDFLQSFCMRPSFSMISLYVRVNMQQTFIHRILKFHDININKNRTWLCFLYLRWQRGTQGRNLEFFTIFSFFFQGFLAILCEIIGWTTHFYFRYCWCLHAKCLFCVTKKIVFAAAATRIELNGNMCTAQFYKYDEPILSQQHVDYLPLEEGLLPRINRNGVTLCDMEHDRPKI